MRSMSKRMVAALFAILLVATSLQAQNIPAELIQYPELIVHNGKIVTMSDATLNDSLGRTVQAMAVRNKRILAVGSNSEVLRLAGPQTRQIDLGGRTVVPGMINPHTHVHTRALGRWVVNNPDAVVEVARRFSVGGGRLWRDHTRNRAGHQGTDGESSSRAVGLDQPSFQRRKRGIRHGHRCPVSER